MNEAEIKKEAKQIMDNFVKALSKIEKIKEQFGAERKIFARANPSYFRAG